MNNLDDYEIHINLPESLNKQNVNDVARVIDESLQRYNTIIPRVLIYPVIDSLPSDLVNALAVQLHCDFYDYTLSLEKRREIVKQSIAWHRIKGTRGAVELAVRAVFGNVKVEEWYEYGGKPYTFRVTIEGAGAFDKTHGIDLLMRVINASKNVRSWLEGKDDESGITIHYELSLSEEDTIKYGFANIIDGMASIGIARPDGFILPYSTDVFAGISSRRQVGAGPDEITAKLIESLGFAYVNAGCSDIPANLYDLPEWYRSITQPARIRDVLGFTYYRKGWQSVPLAMPGDGLVLPTPTTLSLLTGRKLYGLALPETALQAIRFGRAVAPTGQRQIEADLSDLAEWIKDIREPAIIIARKAIKTVRNGRKRISLGHPAGGASECVRFGQTGAITGYVIVGANRSDLPPDKRMRAHVGLMQTGLSAVG